LQVPSHASLRTPVQSLAQSCSHVLEETGNSTRAHAPEGVSQQQLSQIQQELQELRARQDLLLQQQQKVAMPQLMVNQLALSREEQDPPRTLLQPSAQSHPPQQSSELAASSPQRDEQLLASRYRVVVR
jgi:hypothetical protein